MKLLSGISLGVGLLSLAALAMYFATPPVHGQAAGCTDQALALAEGQLTDTIAYLNTSQFANNTNPANANKWTAVTPATWTSGFFPGWMWFMYEKTLNDSWRTRAQAQTATLLSQASNAADHDIGFKILGSYGNGYRITRDPAYMNVIQTAAQTMSTLYRPAAGVIESWPTYDSHITVIIDNMMNLELLFFAAQNGGDPAWRDMAISHALKTMQNHVRADGGTYHAVDYNADGTVFSKFTVQGAGNETTWARGQAWGLYGFATTYRYTRDPRFLDAAQRLADYFINNLPPDFVPYWDFSKCCTDPRDSSAAAIAAAGLLELSTYMPSPTDSARYRDAALNIQSSLSSPAYLGDRAATDGILLHGSANVPINSQVDLSLIYGDYYFVEGCFRAKPLPASPANLTATVASDTEVDLAWDPQTAPTRYTVKRASAPTGPYTTLAPPPVLTTSNFSDTGLTPGATYYYAVSSTNLAGEGPDSASVSVTTSNAAAVPAISSIAPATVAAGTGFTLTVNGKNFVAASVLKLAGKPEPTTFVSSTKLTAAVPAADIPAGGTPRVTVGNPAPAGESPAMDLTVNDFTLAAPSAPVTLAAGGSAAITITVAPSSANGFANPVNFSVSGLPAGTTASFSPSAVTPGASSTTTTLTLTAASTASAASTPPFPGSVKPNSAPRSTLQHSTLQHSTPTDSLPRLNPASLPSAALWSAGLFALALLALSLLALYWRYANQGPSPQRDFVNPLTASALSPLFKPALPLVLLCLGVASGCGGGAPKPTPPARVSHVVITASSGTDVKTTAITLSVQ